jgi:hypothetical protein
MVFETERSASGLVDVGVDVAKLNVTVHDAPDVKPPLHPVEVAMV